MVTSLKSYLKDHPKLRVIVYAGKGGLGKSTASAATAYWLAKNGQKALCFSTDPQASLTDVFETDLFGKGEKELKSNLYAIEIDGDKRIAEFQEEVRKQIKEMYKLEEIPEEIDEYINTASSEPAMYESATYDAMAGLLSKGRYDVYILDMPPFGHGVRMISMATILDAWIDKMEEARRKAAEFKEAEATIRGGGAERRDAVLDELRSIRQKLDLFRQTLTNPENTAFLMVLIPEKMAILDTRRALKMFQKLDITLSGVIVNQVYPPSLLEREELSPFLRNRIEMQQKYMKSIRRELGDYVRAVVPMFDREPKGFTMLDKVADHLFETPGI